MRSVRKFPVDGLEFLISSLKRTMVSGFDFCALFSCIYVDGIEV